MSVGILPTITNGGGGGSGSITGSLAGLSDVSIATPISAQILSYGNDGKWHNTNLSSNPEFQNLQAQISTISVSGYTPLTTTAATSATLEAHIQTEITNRQLGDQNLQQQINEVAGSCHVVFSEVVTGDGITKQFQLTGAVSNGQFISGGWQPLNVLTTLNSDVTDSAGKPIYDGGILSIFTRHRIYVDNINVSALVTLDYVPLADQVFKIWYWYDLQPTDRINNYYREDYVATMEQSDGDLATNIQANVVNFNKILGPSDNTVQRALETLDDHIHPEIVSISASVINLQNTKQDNITLLAGPNVTIVESPLNTWTISASGGSTTNTSVQFPWKFDSSIISNDPGSGDFRLDSVDISASSHIFISKNTNDGVNTYNILNSLKSGDKLYFQNSSDSTQALLVSISGSVTNNTNWFDIPFYIEGNGSSYTFTNNKIFQFVIIKGNGQGSLLAGDGITLTPTGSDTIIGVSDYIGRTEVSNISGYLQSEIVNISSVSNDALHIGLNIISTGVISGGVLTAASSSSFNIGAGFGLIVDHTLLNDSFNPSATVYHWDNITNISVSPFITAGFPYIFVGIDKNVTPFITTHEFTPEERRNYMELGKVSLRGGNIAAVVTKKSISVDYGASIFDIADAIGSLNLTGNVYSASGDNLAICKSSGTSFRYSINYNTNLKQPSNTIDPAISPVTFFKAYRNIQGNDFVYVKNQVSIDPDMWDDGSGTLNTVPNGSYTVQRIYYFPGGNNTYVLYGQAVYSNITQARLSINTENFIIPDDVLNGSTFRGWVILRSKVTSLNNPSDALFIPATKFGTAGGGGSLTISQNHNDLTGLQGGTANEYYHLTSAQISDYVGLSTVQSISAQMVTINANVVHLDGNESISGSKNFINTPTVSGSFNVLHTGNAFFEYYQGTPSALWTINHNLNRHPSVTTATSAGSVIIGTVTYINNNTVTIRFTPARTGFAYFN